MLSQQIPPVSHAGEDRASCSGAERDAATLANLVHANDLLAADNMEFSAGERVITMADLITADDVVLLMSRRASKLFGAIADGYPGVDKMQKGILDGALRGWIALCCPPDCFGGAVDAFAGDRDTRTIDMFEVRT